MKYQFSSVNILGVRVDKVTYQQAVENVVEWIKRKDKHYIVTPNIEFIMKAQKDAEFKRILNKADLCIPDSARIGWAARVLEEKSLSKRLLLLPFCLLPRFRSFNLKTSFPVTTGIDLIYFLCEAFSKKGFTVGFLGGKGEVAKKASERLKKLYPGLRVIMAEGGGDVDLDGIEVRSGKWEVGNIDLLLIAFGGGKQEKWIAQNLPHLPVKVMMGVGGAFDYISGSVPRAPLFLRKLGLEWLFRLILQPWRIKRQFELVKFVGKMVGYK